MIDGCVTCNQPLTFCSCPRAHPLVESDLCFSWLCPECSAVNHCGWSHYRVYGPTHECKDCELAVSIEPPSTIKFERLK